MGVEKGRERELNRGKYCTSSYILALILANKMEPQIHEHPRKIHTSRISNS
jgi:hypothetical protein